MKKLYVALLVLLGSFSNANAIEINQMHSTEFAWDMERSARIVADGLNEALRSYGCIVTEINTKVTRELKSSVFGKDKPGLVNLTYHTICTDPSLKDFQFSASLPWYDEDYGQVYYRMKVGSKTKIDRFCWYYNFIKGFKDCKKIFNDTIPESWSKPVK